MDKGKLPVQEMEEAFARIQIEGEDQGLCYENDAEDLSDIDTRWCLVGRFLTDSPIDFQAMQHKMASLWRPGRGLYVKPLEGNRFIFQFYHEIDIQRVIEGSPWTFGRFHLVLERLKDGDNPRTVEIKRIDLWVQLHGMHSGFMSQRVATDVGNYIGKYVDGDPNNFVGVWREFLRIRVSLPLDSPIKRRMKLKKSDKDWCWVTFKYEAIPTFCFICGMIGHGERYCERIFDTPGGIIEKPYGAWLRAEPRRKTHTMGDKWLKSGGASQAKNSGMGNMESKDKAGPVKVAQDQQIATNSGIGVTVGAGDKGGNVGINANNMELVNLNAQNQFTLNNSNTERAENEGGPDTSELIVVESKRRRVGLDQLIDSSLIKEPNIVLRQEQDTDMDTYVGQETESKNEFLAGAATQTRHSS